MNKHRLGTVCIIISAAFFLAAVLFAAHQYMLQYNARQTAQEILIKLEEETPFVQPQQLHAEEIPQEQTEQETFLPQYYLDPQLPMPEQNVDGIAYVGAIEIPSLMLKLPVISETTDELLRLAPCRLAGTAYLENMVIGGHNYSAHFGRIDRLRYGDPVLFTDMDGNCFTYQVATVEILRPDQRDLLCDGQWPLSLYTCTVGGRSRVVVRCETLTLPE